MDDLKLDEKQQADFKKINDDFMAKAKANQEANRAEMQAIREKRKEQHTAMLAMHDEKNEQMKKIMTDEQYKQYLDKQQFPRDRKDRPMFHKGPRGKKRPMGKPSA